MTCSRRGLSRPEARDVSLPNKTWGVEYRVTNRVTLAVTLSDELLDQLGLDLHPATDQVKMVIVDHIESPSDN
jgi:uncharacterized protein (TIGR03435 family)